MRAPSPGPITNSDEVTLVGNQSGAHALAAVDLCSVPICAYQDEVVPTDGAFATQAREGAQPSAFHCGQED